MTKLFIRGRITLPLIYNSYTVYCIYIYAHTYATLCVYMLHIHSCENSTVLHVNFIQQFI